MPFVLDNTVVCGWVLESQATDYTAAIGDRLGQDRAVAPPLLALEYTNVMRSLCKRQRLIASQAQAAIALLANLDIELDPGRPNPAHLFDLALRYDLSSCDAVYLDLALRRNLPIATQDQALAHAAVVAGVGVVCS